MSNSFKVGDRVRRINYAFPVAGASFMPVGQEGTVKSICGPWCTLESTGDKSHDYENLELVKPKAVAGPLQVGDRVRVYGFCGYSKGTVSTFTDTETMIDPAHVWVIFDEGDKFNLGGGIYIEAACAHPKQCRRLKKKATA